MGIAERRQRQKEEVRCSILQAAWQLVEKEGWQALSIRKIAEAIEYSVPVIYDHFENKEAILLEFTKRGFRQLNEELVQAREGVADPAGQLEAIAYAYRDFAFNHKEYYQLMYGLGMPSCETVRSIPELATFTGLILSCLKELIALSPRPETDPYLKLHTFWSMLHGLVSIDMMGGEQPRDEMNQKVLQDFICGFISGIKG
ncbi:TetR/AcrR family transcriptional regulator [Paraflavisolibacter sp. H34]|uniref:TetR/AcrR family transcriptional regulator n=1 Tax=Huijunlia imazamoxiresistens TaxID=3127457 RepID=UPI00301709B3